jgi:hypothetical protein
MRYTTDSVSVLRIWAHFFSPSSYCAGFPILALLDLDPQKQAALNLGSLVTAVHLLTDCYRPIRLTEYLHTLNSILYYHTYAILVNQAPKACYKL